MSSVCIYKITDDATDVWSSCPSGNALYQVQMKHDARPSVMYSFINNFNSFLKKENEQNNEVPASLADLAREAYIRLVVANSEDANNYGFVPWRNAFYVCGDLESVKNFLVLCNGFFIYMKGQLARAESFDVEVYPSTGVDLLFDDGDVSFKMHSPSKVLPMKIFEAQPSVKGIKYVSNVYSCFFELGEGIFSCMPTGASVRLW